MQTGSVVAGSVDESTGSLDESAGSLEESAAASPPIGATRSKPTQAGSTELTPGTPRCRNVSVVAAPLMVWPR